MKKTIYYVRHGESDANVRGVTAGAELDSPLTENGKAQAKRAGNDLKDKGIELVVCSPMERTVDTAKIIAAQIGYVPSKIVKNPSFIERRVGVFSNKPHQDYVKAVRESENHEGLESRQEMFERVKRGFEWLQQREEKIILIVSHGGTGRTIRAIVNDTNHKDIYKVEGFGNTEIFEFEL